MLTVEKQPASVSPIKPIPRNHEPELTLIGSQGISYRRADELTFPERGRVLSWPARAMALREQVAELIAYFRARMGRAYGFRFKDWTDHQALAQTLGTGDGTTSAFQLVKRYAGGGEVTTRTIAKPVAGTVKIYRDGVQATSGWSVNSSTGLVTISTAPAIGVIVTVDFEFDVPARFDTDQMELTIATYELGSRGQIPVIEIR